MQSEIKPKEYSADLQPIVLKRVAIVYGPYLNVPKLSYKPLKIHFRNVEPDLADIMFERTVQVGYGTGKLHINDFHSLRNQGPK